MYSNEFFIIFWVVGLLILLPFFLVWAVYSIISMTTSKERVLTIEDMLKEIQKADSKNSFEKKVEKFKKKYITFTDKKDDIWFECVKLIAGSTFWDTDSIAKFGQHLEDSNKEKAKKISIVISSALKMKEVRAKK